MKQLLLTLICAFCSSCSQEEQKAYNPPPKVQDNNAIFRDFGEQADWKKKLQALNSKNLKQQVKNLKNPNHFHILQIGDSHTAGDYFSDTARKSLQAKYGNGGAGFFQPNKVSGQRNALINFEGGANTHSSKSEGGFFNLGGVSTEAQPELRIYERDNFLLPQKVKIVASTFNADAVLEVKDGKGQIFNLKVQNPDLAEFQHLSFRANLPLKIYDPTGSWVLHGISLERPNSGVIYSSVGINGAQINMLERWSFDESIKFINPDLVILSFGTNEAFNSMEGAEVYQKYMDTIARIRTALPKTAILVVGAPESLRNTNGNCGTRPQSLFSVQAAQLKAAADARTLYWSWEKAMGGSCTMKKWITQGLAAKDGVHFSKDGYQRAGNVLAQDLVK